MKTLILIFLFALSLVALEKEYVRKIPTYVIDTKSMGMINAKQAFYIIGNSKHGMMKDNFAFFAKEDAQAYISSRGGCVVDYETYVKMNDADIQEYVKEHGVVIEKKEIVKKVDKNNTKDPSSDVYSKENMNKYKF